MLENADEAKCRILELRWGRSAGGDWQQAARGKEKMSTFLIIIILILLFGGGGGYWAYGTYGGAGLGGVLGTVLVILLFYGRLGCCDE